MSGSQAEESRAGDSVEDQRHLVAGVGGRGERVKGAADLIRAGQGYSWVGMYDVSAEEILAVAWCGPGAQAFRRFPVGRGLNGAAVCVGGAGRRAVRRCGPTLSHHAWLHAGRDSLSRPRACGWGDCRHPRRRERAHRLPYRRRPRLPRSLRFGSRRAVEPTALPARRLDQPAAPRGR